MSTKFEQLSQQINKSSGRPGKRQLKLLSFLSSRAFSDEEIEDIQNLIADYYAEKADTEMDAWVEAKGWTQEDLDRMANEHIRTPYNPEEKSSKR